MLTLTPRSRHARTSTQPSADRANPRTLQDDLKTVAIGLGTVQMLLDVGQAAEARRTLRTIRDELQALRRSLPA